MNVLPLRAQDVRQESSALFAGEAERKRLCLRAGFLSLGATDFLDQMILCGGRLSRALWDV